ncbi:asparaginase [Streptomyces sp. KR55]|uniref:asparaginase n=1 Tax=Streptomyces sp. KR55 TaxID=3457425 RepID=UPI003FD38571
MMEDLVWSSSYGLPAEVSSWESKNARMTIVCTSLTAFGDAEHANVLTGSDPKNRLEQLADFLDIDWTWVTTRCRDLGERSVAGLVRSRSRLLTVEGVDDALSFLGTFAPGLWTRRAARFPRLDPERQPVSSSSPRPNGTVEVITLGGTIAMTRSGSEKGGVKPSLTGADLIAAVPELSSAARITVEDFRQLPGASLTPGDIVALVDHITKAEADGVQGVVVTQGTDTLEETAFLTDLYHQGSVPVVFTGAMRNPSLPGADGPANLLAAVQTAVAPEARGLGVLVVLGDDIHAAGQVRKMHTTSVAAFASPGTGPIGQVVEGAPRIRSQAKRYQAVPFPHRGYPRVEVVTATLGSDGVVLDALQDKVEGFVIAAFGVGHVPASWCDRLEALAATMPVVLASRIGTGPVLASTYAFPGSESDLLARGLIGAGALDSFKARLLLSAHLAAGSSRTEIEAAFAARR